MGNYNNGSKCMLSYLILIKKTTLIVKYGNCARTQYFKIKLH
jgi:hypothetical protein